LRKRNGDLLGPALFRTAPFLKALGRPSREKNVTTSKDEQANTFTSLSIDQMANFPIRCWRRGADIWLKRYSTIVKKIIDELYQKSMGREPTDQEKEK